MSATESALEVFLPFTEFEHQTVIITMFIEYKLFRHKARYQTFLKVLLLLLTLKTLHMVLPLL